MTKKAIGFLLGSSIIVGVPTGVGISYAVKSQQYKNAKASSTTTTTSTETV